MTKTKGKLIFEYMLKNNHLNVRISGVLINICQISFCDADRESSLQRLSYSASA